MRNHPCVSLQIKATVLLMPNGSDKVTVTPLPAYKSDKSVTVRGCLCT